MENAIKPLAKSVLIPLGLTPVASAVDVGIKKKKSLGSVNTTLRVSNDELEDIIKVVKSLEDSSLLLKGVIETIQNKAKEQKGEFLSMLLGTLGASLLGNIFPSKGVNIAGEGILRAVYGSSIKIKDQYCLIL